MFQGNPELTTQVVDSSQKPAVQQLKRQEQIVKQLNVGDPYGKPFQWRNPPAYDTFGGPPKDVVPNLNEVQPFINQMETDMVRRQQEADKFNKSNDELIDKFGLTHRDSESIGNMHGVPEHNTGRGLGI